MNQYATYRGERKRTDHKVITHNGDVVLFKCGNSATPDSVTLHDDPEVGPDTDYCGVCHRERLDVEALDSV